MEKITIGPWLLDAASPAAVSRVDTTQLLDFECLVATIHQVIGDFWGRTQWTPA